MRAAGIMDEEAGVSREIHPMPPPALLRVAFYLVPLFVRASLIKSISRRPDAGTRGFTAQGFSAAFEER